MSALERPDLTILKPRGIAYNNTQHDSTTRAPTKLDFFQFEIYAGAGDLRAAAGVLDSVSIDTVSEAATEGTWYLEGKVVINETSGIISGHDVYWTESLSTNTATNYFIEIGRVDFEEESITIGDTVIERNVANVTQYTYGPIIAVAHGQPNSKWGCTLY